MNGIMKILRKCPRSISLRYIGISNLDKQQEKPHIDNFVPVYKFPYIRPFAMINRIKYYHTILTATSIPVSVILNQMKFVDFGAIQVTGALGISGCVTLYSLGFLTDKFIGFIYYNEEKDLAKVAYVDFWGKRKDITIPANDIVPLKELPSVPWDGLFLTFRRFSTKETLRLNMYFGIIIDKEKIGKIL